MTRVQMFLNELSYGHEVDDATVDDAMRAFVQALRHVRKRRTDVALLTQAPLPSLEITPGTYLGGWLDRNIEHKRFIQRLRDRSPISAGLLADIRDAEHFHGDRAAESLAAAYESDGLALSLRLRPEWRTSWVTLTRHRLVEDDDGNLREDKDKVDVRHGSCADELVPHEGWLTSAGLKSVVTGAELWDACGDFFPHLSFLPRVADQVRKDLQRSALGHVRERLCELEAAVAEWHPTRTAQPAWRSDVSGESASRRRLCYFTDLDGEQRLFEMHARYQPRPGRIYFRLDPAAQKIVIAHIGEKIAKD